MNPISRVGVLRCTHLKINKVPINRQFSTTRLCLAKPALLKKPIFPTNPDSIFQELYRLEITIRDGTNNYLKGLSCGEEFLPANLQKNRPAPKSPEELAARLFLLADEGAGVEFEKVYKRGQEVRLRLSSANVHDIVGCLWYRRQAAVLAQFVQSYVLPEGIELTPGVIANTIKAYIHMHLAEAVDERLLSKLPADYPKDAMTYNALFILCMTLSDFERGEAYRKEMIAAGVEDNGSTGSIVEKMRAAAFETESTKAKKNLAHQERLKRARYLEENILTGTDLKEYTTLVLNYQN
ncbi:hypothetical protein PROFUN_02204 [Planoprotostelium fungivorum]|uniref:Uncharacterized protein n=1 Tax=Planoprotostelium fungivorum TaxID=1890364 RepID=A0A2P6NZG0_9EUKA|nr:hypothetical protein PROFUN_02204 [Planoprotostelium fungivorum]